MTGNTTRAMARFRLPLRAVAVLPVITALLFSWVCHGVRLASPDTPHFGDGSFGHPAMPSTSGVVASWDACFVITAVPTADDWLPRLFSAPQPGWTGHDGPNPALHASTLRWMGGGSATSVRLNATTYAWVFSDSVIGEWLAGPPGIPGSRQRSGARIPHQTVSVMSGLHGDRQQPDRMRYYWKSQPSGAAVSMFSPDGQASSSRYASVFTFVPFRACTPTVPLLLLFVAAISATPSTHPITSVTTCGSPLAAALWHTTSTHDHLHRSQARCSFLAHASA